MQHCTEMGYVYHMQLNVKQLKSYFKHTTDFINKRKKLPKISLNGFLVSMDLRSPHTNVPNHEDLQVPT